MLLRFDPLRDFDRLAEQMLSDRRSAHLVAMDVFRSGDHYVLHFDLPGIAPESVELSVHDNVLTVKAMRPKGAAEDAEYLVSERPTGEFTRQLVLSNGLDYTKIAATFDAGVLTVTIPVAEAAKPRRIQIGSSGQEQPQVIKGEVGRRSAVGSGT